MSSLIRFINKFERLDKRSKCLCKFNPTDMLIPSPKKTPGRFPDVRCNRCVLHLAKPFPDCGGAVKVMDGTLVTESYLPVRRRGTD